MLEAVVQHQDAVCLTVPRPHEFGAWLEARHRGERRALGVIFSVTCQRGELAFHAGKEAAKGGLLQLVGNGAHQQVTA